MKFKNPFRLLFYISFCLNGVALYFIYMKHLEYKKLERIFLNQASIKNNSNSFFEELVINKVDTTKIDYFYLNIWHTTCIPCVKEMPYLDSLAGHLSSTVKCIIMTDQDDTKIINFLKKKKVSLKHFVAINDMKLFLAALSNDKHILSHTYPLHLILNKNLEILYSSIGASSGRNILLEQKFRKLKLLN